jgi:hypothetical protein
LPPANWLTHNAAGLGFSLHFFSVQEAIKPHADVELQAVAFALVVVMVFERESPLTLTVEEDPG